VRSAQEITIRDFLNLDRIMQQAARMDSSLGKFWKHAKQKYLRRHLKAGLDNIFDWVKRAGRSIRSTL
jgi:hypothetical protein